MNQDSGQDNKNPWRALAVVGVVGANLAIFLLMGIWSGKKLDIYFHSSPIFLIIGMIVGFVLGIWSVIGLIKPFLGD
ncbi:AtpZ/AtpI family protein [Tepidibacillus fermentans]|uniref:Putative F0F1-ATPase subunit (Ca2+/Mg2+ transporter) n=1 Tax=Tepidibacillus fermentans TaxID=1281767 RepID=A0A4R3KJR5_9BACI|nr:AtpZ/AtpI family protein [Tepidibacillus fermentans]TCS83411.1 putative F0F1-ATPase subunit (Ca2+/Mg2+ transporter) [Tepidibacillus fermentans]